MNNTFTVANLIPQDFTVTLQNPIPVLTTRRIDFRTSNSEINTIFEKYFSEDENFRTFCGFISKDYSDENPNGRFYAVDMYQQLQVFSESLYKIRNKPNQNWIDYVNEILHFLNTAELWHMGDWIIPIDLPTMVILDQLLFSFIYGCIFQYVPCNEECIVYLKKCREKLEEDYIMTNSEMYTEKLRTGELQPNTSKLLKNYKRGFITYEELVHEARSFSTEEDLEVLAYCFPDELYVCEGEEFEEFESDDDFELEEENNILLSIDDAVPSSFMDMYNILKDAYSVSESERLRKYGTDGLKIIQTMFLDNFKNDGYIYLYTNDEYMGGVWPTNKSTPLDLIKIGYLPVPEQFHK